MKYIPEWSAEAKALKPGTYRHFKGDEYELLNVARDSETTEEVVVYQSLKHPDRVWVRPLKMFIEEVDKPELGYKGPRFKKLTSDRHPANQPK